MIDSTPLTVIDEGPAGTTQLVVEADVCSQAEKALQYAFFKASNGAGAVALQSEDVLAGREDGLDPLPTWGQVRPFPGLVFALGPDVSGLKTRDRRGELLARIAFVGTEGFPRPPTHSAPAARAPPPVHRVWERRERRTVSRLHAHSTGVESHEQEIVCETRALPGKDDEEPFEKGSQAVPALEVAGLPRKFGEERGKTVPGHSKEAAVRRDAHDGLSHAQGDDLGIGGPAAGVAFGLWQKIIGWLSPLNQGRFRRLPEKED